MSDSMPVYKVLLVAFQGYTLLVLGGMVTAIRRVGLVDSTGCVNIFVAQLILQWIVLTIPFFYRPFDALSNLGRYVGGLITYYLAYFWWYVIISMYAMTNIDDVSWGNRPSNASGGMNVVVDNVKRQEILKQSYRLTRTNFLIAWLLINITTMYIIDALVVLVVHNGNAAVKETCMQIFRGAAYFNCGNAVLILTASGYHHIAGTLSQMLCSKYTPPAIRKRPPVSSDPETKVLLDDTEEEEEFTPSVIQA